MKKLLFIFIPALIITVVFVLVAQFVMNYNSQKGALQVTSVPESDVYLDGKLIGKTPLCKCEASDMIAMGNYTIRLVPKDKNLSEFQEKITVSSSVLTVVDRKFAKNSLSEGSVISLTPLSDKKKTELLVVSLPQGATILLDNSEIGQTPYSFKDPTVSDHVLMVKKIGYKDKTVRIRTPLGYKLTVAAYLSTIDTLAPLTSTTDASSSAVPSVTSPTGTTVVILETPTGFLRIRDGIDGTEIGKASPGETYAFLSEDSGWFEIKMKDGKSGWVNKQYADKQEN